MKKSIMLFFIFSLLLCNVLVAKEHYPIWIRTSQPTSNMIIVDTSASTTTVLNTKTVDGKKSFVTFTEAFSEFHSRNLKAIQDFVNQKKYDGVCNLKITFNITNKAYYFLSTYDAYVYEKN